MDTAFLNRILRASLLLSALAYLLLFYYKGGAWAFGFLCGSTWSAANFYLLRQLVARGLTLEEKRWAPLVALALVKFPLLYLVGFLILRQSSYAVAAPLCGFALPFCILVLKAAGRMMLGLDGPDAGRRLRSAFERS